MSSESGSHHYSPSDWNNAAALNHLKVSAGPTSQGGQIIRPVLAESQDNTESNIHTIFEPRDYGAGRLPLPTDRSGRVKAPMRSKGFVGNESYPQSSLTSRTASSSATRENEPPPSRPTWQNSHYDHDHIQQHLNRQSPKYSQDHSLTPHTRPSSPAPAEKTAEDSNSEDSLSPSKAQQSFDAQKLDLENPTRPSTVFDPANLPAVREVHEPVDMTPGLHTTHFIRNKELICMAKGCGMVFLRKKDRKSHCMAKHEYCDICDLLFDDDLQLLDHRKELTVKDMKLPDGGKHNACLVCGDEFNSAGGRRRHTKMSHPEEQDISCPGCDEIFHRGASLLSHVYSNKCKDRSGLVSTNHLKTARVTATLQIEQEMIAATGSQDTETRDSVTKARVALPDIFEHDNDAEGGIQVQDNKLNDMCNSWMDGKSTDADDNESEIGSLDREAKREAMPIEKPMESMSIAESSAVAPSMAKKLFPNAKATPNVSGWRTPVARAPIRRRIPETVNQAIALFDRAVARTGQSVITDWDGFKFFMDVEGRVECPFQRCEVTFETISAVKTHLISGVHSGSDDRCIKCYKQFSSAIALLAHMESGSTRCDIRRSPQYGHLVYMISGGFIDVYNPETHSTNLSDGTPRLRAPSREELIEQKEAGEKLQADREAKRLQEIEKQW